MPDNRSINSDISPDSANNEATPVAKNEKESVNSETNLQDSGEYGGPKGLEPTRYGDWESSGRCVDF